VSEFPADPTVWLPHREPFLLIDEVLSIDPGRSATASWTLRGDEWFFAGHFPGQPLTPGVLLIESIAQCGAVAVLADPRYAGKLPLFGGGGECQVSPSGRTGRHRGARMHHDPTLRSRRSRCGSRDA
jgi:3-hydroxymyristoyl/3-hydroxydecanoyl-(acyl carrier protein) dehydratase